MIRSPRPKVKGMLKIGALLVVVAFILFIWANARPLPVRVQVTFTGFTNLDVTYTTRSGTFPITLAYFCVSNAGKCSVLEYPIFGYDMKKEAAVTGPHLGDGSLMSELKPGQFKTISLTTPWDNREPWRAILVFSKADWRYKLRQKSAWVLETIRPFLSERWIDNYHAIEFYSDWVNGPELVPATTSMVKAPLE
jgi:hypothetical protein